MEIYLTLHDTPQPACKGCNRVKKFRKEEVNSLIQQRLPMIDI